MHNGFPEGFLGVRGSKKNPPVNRFERSPLTTTRSIGLREISRLKMRA